MTAIVVVFLSGFVFLLQYQNIRIGIGKINKTDKKVLKFPGIDSTLRE